MSWIDLLLFGPPLLIGVGAWIGAWGLERFLQADRAREQRQGVAAE